MNEARKTGNIRITNSRMKGTEVLSAVNLVLLVLSAVNSDPSMKKYDLNKEYQRTS